MTDTVSDDYSDAFSGESLKRVAATPLTKEWLAKLKAIHGPLLIHQSGGCCDGSSPMCYPLHDFKIGQNDVYLGEIEGTPVYIGDAQFEYWRHTGLLIDVVKGRGSGFSVESPEGIRFLTRSHVFTEDEMKRLASQGEPLRGPQHLDDVMTPFGEDEWTGIK